VRTAWEQDGTEVNFIRATGFGGGVANGSVPGAVAPARLAGTVKTAPSASCLYALDAVNLFLAGTMSGFGPYVAALLASQNWPQAKIGFVLTAAGLAGLASQIPSGELLDKMPSKRMAVALGATIVAAAALTRTGAFKNAPRIKRQSNAGCQKS